MKDELLIISGFDQDLPSGIDENGLLQKVQEEINKAADNHDVMRATQICAYFQTATKLSGKSLAHALFTFNQRWDDFGIGEDFIDYIEAQIGIVRHTVERYIRVAELLPQVPEKYRDQIERKGIQQLIPIANAVAQGYTLEDENWRSITEATSYYEVQQIINVDVKNVDPRESSLNIRMHRDGSIVVYKGEQGPFFVGSLEIGDSNELVRAAIERMTKNAGVISV